MKTIISILSSTVVLALTLPVATMAATQVYDLSADWSDTENPNGPWTYRAGDHVMMYDGFEWYDGFYQGTLAKNDLSTGYVEPGDLVVFPGDLGENVNILWTAPESGTISISGSIWHPWSSFQATWSLSLNGGLLSNGWVYSGLYDRSMPYDLSLGLGGASALQDIPVVAGDQLVLEFRDFDCAFLYTIVLTTESLDPIAATVDLATTVVDMNLDAGIDNSLDSKLDSALNALDDMNENNDGAAFNSLDAFINAVEAQRGKKLTDAQADQLTTSAQEIQASLNEGN